jgi:two-component system, OmpR family, response regulator RegX3
MTKLLLVDDDAPLARMVKSLAEKEGYLVSVANSAEDALVDIRKNPPDLAVLDVRLPGMSGFDLCLRLREDKDVPPFPVIFLTSKGDEPSRIMGLEMGGDDYLVKPFSTGELLARIKAVLRRRRSVDGGKEEVLSDGGLRVDIAAHAVTLDGARLDIPKKEYDMLCLFLRKKNRVLTRPYLMENVWGREYTQSSRTIDTHVRRLRRRLRDAGVHIQTVEGVGYKWE